MKLHWQVTTGSTIQLAVTASGSAITGWFGMGFGKALKMFPADCIIGNQAGSPIPVGMYNSSSYSSVKLTTAFTIGSKAYTTSGTTATMTFTRTTGDGGAAPVLVRGMNNIIWAYSGSSTSVGSHANKCVCSSLALMLSLVLSLSLALALSSIVFAFSPYLMYLPTLVSTLSRQGNHHRRLLLQWLPSASAVPFSSSTSFSPLSCLLSPPSCLLSSGLILHWDPVSAKQVDMAIEAKAAGNANAGWISVGWPAKAAMVPADAVIGNLPGGRVATYALKGYRSTKLLLPASTAAAAAAAGCAVTDGKAHVCSCLLGTCTHYPVSPPSLAGFRTGVAAKFASAAVSRLIWAFSSSGSTRLNFHESNFGTAKVDFSCRVAPSNDPSPDLDDEL
ncbi:unnamed protein product [Closterium sp. NIES-54]